MADRVNGKVVLGVSVDDDDAFTSTTGPAESAYDCCVASLGLPGSVSWFWNSESKMCFEVESRTCRSPQINGDIASVVVARASFGYTFGNSYCGQLTRRFDLD